MTNKSEKPDREQPAVADQSPAEIIPPTSAPPVTGSRVVITVVLVMLILLAGAGGTAMLVAKRDIPPQDKQPRIGPLVTTLTISRQTVPVRIEGYGTVEPRVMIDVVPQVSGRVIAVSDNLTDGGTFSENETLIQIDQADYELAVQRARAGLAQAEGAVQTATAAVRRAETALELEQAQADVAIAEWQSRHADTTPPTLLAREPQIRERQAEIASAEAQLASANAAVQAAQAQIREAELALERTSIAVPFYGRVMNRSVDVGQFVVAGQPLARVYGTDVAQIIVPFEDDKLNWFNVPGGKSSPSDNPIEPRDTPVIITARFAGEDRTWQGKVARTTGRIDTQSRMVHVVIEVERPFDTAQHTPLVPGMFVKVVIEGRPLNNVAKLPRHVVRDDGVVWIAEHNRLTKRTVTIVWSDRDHVYLRNGINDGDRVITSMLDVVADGMTIRVDDDHRSDASAQDRVSEH